jgi:hypothetical protein
MLHTTCSSPAHQTLPAKRQRLQLLTLPSPLQHTQMPRRALQLRQSLQRWLLQQEHGTWHRSDRGACLQYQACTQKQQAQQLLVLQQR